MHAHLPISHAVYVAAGNTSGRADHAAGASPGLGQPEEPFTRQLAADRCEEVSRQLLHVAQALRSTASDPDAVQAQPVEQELVECLVRVRRQRERFFDPVLFADPAWDMLLDLYLADLEQRQSTVCGLCAAAGTPATTALRYLKLLVDRGLVTRTQSETDQRVTYVALSDAAQTHMRSYFRRFAELLPPISGR